MVCLSFGGSFHFRHMWLRQVTPVFQERQQTEGNRRWRRREEKRLSEQIRIRGGKPLKSCAPSPSSTSWPALYLFAKRSSRQRQDIFGALNYIHHCENIPTKIKVLCFERPIILALACQRFYNERAISSHWPLFNLQISLNLAWPGKTVSQTLKQVWAKNISLQHISMVLNFEMLRAIAFLKPAKAFLWIWLPIIGQKVGIGTKEGVFVVCGSFRIS